MNFPINPHYIALKSFGEVFNRLLIIYSIENESAP